MDVGQSSRSRHKENVTEVVGATSSDVFLVIAESSGFTPRSQRRDKTDSYRSD